MGFIPFSVKFVGMVALSVAGASKPRPLIASVFIKSGVALNVACNAALANFPSLPATMTGLFNIECAQDMKNRLFSTSIRG